MSRDRRVRPQALVFSDTGDVSAILYSTNGSDGVSIATALAETSDGGYTWTDNPSNPVLDRIESAWQFNRAFVTGLTWDDTGDRWVMATVGNDTTENTPGMRAVGLWFSDDLVTWTEYPDNPIITVETDNAYANTEVFPEDSDAPVGMYLRDFRKFDGVWYALVQWRGNGTWSRMIIMRSLGDITGPWTIRNRCLTSETTTEWSSANDKLNWSQPIAVNGRWYAVCQNGVAENDTANHHVGLVYSDDYFNWAEMDNPVTPPLTRPDGSAIISSQQFLLPPKNGHPWHILLGARGVNGDDYMYLVEPEQPRL